MTTARPAGSAGATAPLIVTGTDTGVGKTIVTAAIAAAAIAAGLRVAVLKPAQTGLAAAVREGAGEEPDARTVARLAAPATCRTLVSYPDPLAPHAAARVSGAPGLGFEEALAAVRGCAGDHDLVLIEGAGGLLVPMGPSWTIADLAAALRCPAVVVVRAGLGTLNHTALTLEACARRDIGATVVIGAWPAEPELVHRQNLLDLPGELGGVLPEGAGALDPRCFRVSAPAWLAPALHGRFDRAAFSPSRSAA